MSPVGHIASKYNFRIAHTAMNKYLAQVNIPLSLFGSLSTSTDTPFTKDPNLAGHSFCN